MHLTSNFARMFADGATSLPRWGANQKRLDQRKLFCDSSYKEEDVVYIQCFSDIDAEMCVPVLCNTTCKYICQRSCEDIASDIRRKSWFLVTTCAITSGIYFSVYSSVLTATGQVPLYWISDGSSDRSMIQYTEVHECCRFCKWHAGLCSRMCLVCTSVHICSRKRLVCTWMT